MTIHALLIGINAYPQAPLHGCINDLLAIDAFFKKMCADNAFLWRPRYLLAPHEHEKQAIQNAGIEQVLLPTRKNIITGFSHFSDTVFADEDVCLFYYCGHGSQEPAAPEFHHLKADGMNETLVCLDSRNPDGRDLVDKELAYLLWNVSKNRPENHFLVIMDCCHSGNNTRSNDDSIQTRDMAARHNGTPFNSLYGVKDLSDTAQRLFDLKKGKAYFREEGRYIHLAAARDCETAKELGIDGQRHGVFTWSLLRTLRRGGTTLSYREIMRQTEALVRNRVKDQIPQLDSTDKTLENTQFLGLQLQSQIPEYPLEIIAGQWSINAGQIQGIVPGNDRYPTLFQLTTGNTVNASQVLANYSILDASTLSSIPFSMLQDAKARLLQMPAPRIVIFIDKKIPPTLRQSLEDAFSKKTRFYTDFSAQTLEIATFEASVKDNSFLLSRKGSTSPVFLRQENASDFVAFCESVGKWQAVLEQSNPQTKIQCNDIEIIVETIEGQAVNKNTINFLQGKEIRNPKEIILRYTDAGAPAFRCKVKINKPGGYWVGGLYLDAHFGIADYLPSRAVAIGQEHAFRFFLGNTDFNAIPVKMDKAYFENGVTEITDYLKIFVSTEPFDLTDFRQEPLPLDHQQMRSSGFDDDLPIPMKSDWAAITIPIKIVRTATPVQAQGFKVAGILMKTPLDFLATAAMSSFADIRRKLSNTIYNRGQSTDFEQFVLPPTSMWGHIETDDAVFFRTLDVPADNILSILELTDLQNTILLSPIILQLNEKPSPNETIIPFGYDLTSNDYICLGNTNEEGDIVIHTLPRPTKGRIYGDEAINAADSIKVFFKKIILSDANEAISLAKSIVVGSVVRIESKKIS